MSRRDDHLDAMLRQLGAMYYQTPHGDARASEVARAVASVQDEAARRPGEFPLLQRGTNAVGPAGGGGGGSCRPALCLSAAQVRQRTGVAPRGEIGRGGGATPAWQARTPPPPSSPAPALPPST